MSKAKPKTIADLKINWTFSGYEKERVYQKFERFEKDNPSISHLRIKPENYRFYDGSVYVGNVYVNHSIMDIGWFIEYLNWMIMLYNSDFSNSVLDHFELIEKNKFRIHVKK